MNCDVLNQIDAMLGMTAAPNDETGALRHIAAVLEPLGPTVMWLADGEGRVLAAQMNASFEVTPDFVELSQKCVRRLYKRTSCLFVLDDGSGVFAVAVPVPGDEVRPALFAGLVPSADQAMQARFDAMRRTLTACAHLGHVAVTAASWAGECTVRMRQLQNERDTLKSSYTHIMNSAIEEREQRLREQQRNMEYLEEEVAKRSADLREALGQAKLASESKSEFLANMSHELRTPLTAILGYADLMLDPAQLPAERQECIQTIHRNGRHLLSIINDILDLSKIEAGKMTAEIIDCSPAEIVRDIAAMMRVRAVEKNIAFNCEFPGPIPAAIRSDPTRIRQVLINLVGNAIKFTHHGAVSVITRLEKPISTKGPRLCFEVVDSGIGMTEEQQKRLFQPFSQADNSTTRKYGGTGLGLVICRRLVEMLGGEVRCESRRDRGSRFIVTLDVGALENVELLDGSKVDGPEPVEPHVTPKLDQPLRGRILVAEDGPDNQRLIRVLLTKAGAEVQVAENGRIAVDKALAGRAGKRDQPFDLILMDMQMPELDGYGATAELRRRGYTGPIIALTAHAMASDRDRCIAAGCDDYATKPIDRTKLIALLSKYLRCETKSPLLVT